ncbi:MAG: response regulator [Lachnospiraceae bacterium]|nr:response regulator [Lachnospiraceae bacterium]
MYTIMMVDDDDTELVLTQKTLQDYYQFIPMNNPKSALTRLAKASAPDLIILDVEMPGINGFEMMTRIKTSEKTKNVPVIFLSGTSESTTELECYRLGAVDFIRKPVVPELLKKRIELQVELLDYKKSIEEKTTGLQNTANFYAQNAMRLEYFIIGIITDLIAVKDPYTGTHNIGVSRFFEIILKEMLMSGINYGIDSSDFELIILSSRLHDMGKIGVPDSVLQKQGKYTDEEFKMMKSHTVLAASAIQKYAYLLPNNKFLTYTYQMARFHHERFDGMGYPDRLAGPNIPVLARILAVADVYEAVTADRSYKKAMSHEQAYNIITQGAGVQFDPQVVAAFQRVHEDIAQASIQLKAQFAQNRTPLQ